MHTALPHAMQCTLWHVCTPYRDCSMPAIDDSPEGAKAHFEEAAFIHC